MPLTTLNYDLVTNGVVGLYPGLDHLSREDIEEVSRGYVTWGNEYITRGSNGHILYATFAPDDEDA